MLPGADLRQALQAGLWEALADDSDRAAMRATCRDARDVADALHDTAVLPVGPGTWGSADAIAAYHRQLGAVRSVHVVYSGGATWADEPRAAHFMQAYSAALGAALPAADCSITMPYGTQLPAPLAAALLQRVVPRVERLDMALGSYVNVAQLLQALEPCARLCSLRLLPTHAAEGPDLDDDQQDLIFRFLYYPGALDALCRLPRLHTLSGPWGIWMQDLQRLCDALPSLTTLGFEYLSLGDAPGICISRRLHTLAAWRHSAGHGSLRLDRPWHQQRSTCYIGRPACNLQAALPAVRRLEALVLETWATCAEDLSSIQAAAQRFAACAERWAWKVFLGHSDEQLQVLRGMPPGSLAALQHLIVVCDAQLALGGGASTIGGLVSAAPNITTLAMPCALGCATEALAAMMQPIRRAAHLRTLWLFEEGQLTAAQQGAVLEGVVRCLVQPGAEGGGEYCRALRHVLLAGAQPDALAACRAALARDGICVSVDACELSW